MGPVHTRRNGQRFRCYVTHAKQIGAEGPAAYQVAAEPMERHCCRSWPNICRGRREAWTRLRLQRR
jgi:hypothetical protein